jgi:quercetin dioxygenase-like cupin family protein
VTRVGAIYGGHEHALRQTLIALRAGYSLDEHENPGEATLQVLHGRVTLIAGDDRWNGSPGDLITIPDSRHALEAAENSAVLLTVAIRSGVRLEHRQAGPVTFNHLSADRQPET